MILNVYNGPVPPVGLTPEIKTDWTEKTLTADMLFIHGGPMTPSVYSHGAGQPAMGREIAFPYRIDSADIRFYCTPSTRSTVIARSSEHELGHKTFQMVPWHVVVAAQTPP